MMKLFVSLALVLLANSAVSETPRLRRRLLQEGTAPSSSPKVLEFDGDLDHLVKLAMDRANGIFTEQSDENPTASPSPTLSSAPTLSPISGPNVCPGAVMNRLVVVKWKYTIETVPRANPDTVIGEVEEIVQESLIPLIMQCNNDEAANASIVALEGTLPRDTISNDSTLQQSEYRQLVFFFFA